MTSNIVAVQSLAAAASAAFTVPVTNDSQSLLIQVAAQYTAVTVPSGVKMTLQVSSDGVTFNAANESGVTVAPAATVLGSGSQKVNIEGPLKLDTQPITAVKVTLQNLDATNAAQVALLSTLSAYI